MNFKKKFLLLWVFFFAPGSGSGFRIRSGSGSTDPIESGPIRIRIRNPDFNQRKVTLPSGSEHRKMVGVGEGGMFRTMLILMFTWSETLMLSSCQERDCGTVGPLLEGRRTGSGGIPSLCCSTSSTRSFFSEKKVTKTKNKK
jgi:hypothetical protein